MENSIHSQVQSPKWDLNLEKTENKVENNQNQEQPVVIVRGNNNNNIIYNNISQVVRGYTNNLPTYNSEDKLKALLLLGVTTNNLIKIVNDEVLRDTALFLLENDITYLNGIVKLIGKNKYIVNEKINFLLSQNIIEHITPQNPRYKEFASKIYAFRSYISHNIPNSGRYQQVKTKFYALTPEWDMLLRSIQDILILKSSNYEKIKKIKEVLAQTHKRIKEEHTPLNRIKLIEEFANNYISLKKSTNVSKAEYSAKLWADKFRKAGLIITDEDMFLIFKMFSNSTKPTILLKKDIVEHLKEVFKL